MKKLEILLKAKEILENNSLCKETAAKDSLGVKTYFTKPEACSFCAAGAVWRAGATFLDSRIVDPDDIFVENKIAEEVILDLNNILLDLEGKKLFSWNDQPEITKEDVLSLYSKLEEKYNSQIP